MAGKATTSAVFGQMKRVLDHMKASKGFDGLLKSCEVLEESCHGRCLVSYRVADEHLNKFDTLHGGMGATLVDAITTVAIMGTDKNQRPGVSVNLNVTYLSPAKPGEDLLVDARVIKSGRTLASTECMVTKKENGQAVLSGSHTKFLGHKPSSS